MKFIIEANNMDELNELIRALRDITKQPTPISNAKITPENLVSNDLVSKDQVTFIPTTEEDITPDPLAYLGAEEPVKQYPTPEEVVEKARHFMLADEKKKVTVKNFITGKGVKKVSDLSGPDRAEFVKIMEG